MPPERPEEDNPEEILLNAAFEKTQHYLNTHQFERAAAECRRALAVDPDNAFIHANLGFALRGLKDLDGAESEARLAASLDPENWPPLFLLAQVAMDRGQNTEAEGFLLEALRLAPHEAFLLRTYAQLMFKTGHLEKAEALITASLKQDPENSDAQSLLALIHSERNRGSTAIDHGRRGLQLEPDSDVPHASIGVAYLQSGRPFKARHHLREALRLDPSDDGIEEAFLNADLCCRWIYLPAYYFGILCNRLPGKQFAIWGLFLAIFYFGRNIPGLGRYLGPIAFFYIGFCIYTWFAEPLSRVWIKCVPPKYE